MVYFPFLKTPVIMEKSPIDAEFKDFLSLSLTKCLDSVGARTGSIFLFDKQKNELILEVAQNSRGLRLEGLRQKVGEGVSGKVALRRRPLLVEDATTLGYLRESWRLGRYDTKSFLSVPFECSGDLIGVINITDRESGESFSSDDLATVFGICKYLGTAIYSLKRYIDTQDAARQRLYEEIERLKTTLEHSQNFSSLGKLAGGLVHELNNPLDGIIRYVNLALDHIPSDSIIREYLLESKQGLSRIVKIVRSLLDFSWSLSKTSVFIDVNKAIEECLFMAGDTLSSYQIEVKKALGQNLPNVPDYRLKAVFTNIIKNACDAMGPKGGTLTIQTAINDGCIEIVFSDTGCGVPADIKEKIFDPFFTTKNISEGSGLGLAICYETIQRYNGTISVENLDSVGAAFIIRLPISSHKGPFPHTFTQIER
jgi:signal transduction histidine kinase